MATAFLKMLKLLIPLKLLSGSLVIFSFDLTLKVQTYFQFLRGRKMICDKNFYSPF